MQINEKNDFFIQFVYLTDYFIGYKSMILLYA